LKSLIDPMTWTVRPRRLHRAEYLFHAWPTGP